MPGTPETSADVVSPELVLVDPELADRRRPIELTGAWTSAVHSAAIRAQPASPPIAPVAAELAHAPVIEIEELHPRRRRLVLAVAATAVAGAGVAAAALVLRGGESAPQSRGQALGPAAAPPVTAAVSPAETVVQSPKVTTIGKRKNPATPIPRPMQLSWKRVKFATFYHVILSREGARQLDLWTPSTTLAVRRLRDGRGLRAGRYRWSVRPGYGNLRLRKVPGRTFYGPVVERGVLVVPVSR